MTTETVKEIIARSIVIHPAQFRASLIKQAEMHDDYAELCLNKQAANSARNQRSICLRVYDFVGADDLDERERADAICGDLGMMVIALNVACKLQGIPSHVRSAAIADWEYERAKNG